LRRIGTVFLLGVVFCSGLAAQSHTSVPLENQVYSILEQAETRGLCAPLSGVRPYTRTVVLKALSEILGSDVGQKRGLNETERVILEKYRVQFSKPKTGFDSARGAYYNETTIANTSVPISANLRLGLDAEISGSADSYGTRRFGEELWLSILLDGDISPYVSYGFSSSGGIIRAPRKFLGEYHSYYDGYTPPQPDNGEFRDRLIETYSEPSTHFPYTYKKRWDGSVYSFSDLNTFGHWPNGFSGAYSLESELSASFLSNAVFLRFGRLSHDWGAAPLGTSLALNQMARPFMGIDLAFTPLSWLSYSVLIGALEYYNSEGIKESAWSFQNAFSISMLEARYKNYIYFDIGNSVIWPKRWEPAYFSPTTNYFFYQNNIGDFDNMAMFFTLKGQKPGLGNIWFSLFLDEASLQADMLGLDRTMLAAQGGMVFPVPVLSFSELTISFTKINPYCYTHNRNFVPWSNEWYDNIRRPMELSYTNNGVSLGYYLPPNSEELLVRFKTMPRANITTALQYQLIMHGADFGRSAVDGSSLLSELAPSGRDTDPVLKRYFLRDGAYQWMHVVKAGVEWTVPTQPVSLYAEAGTVYSYFTNINGPANSGSASSFSIINTSEYPHAMRLIVILGVKIFP
jgi:hypothetical protein